MQALFVDLPNFYSHLLESEIDEPRLLRDYFLYWLDFDRLAQVLSTSYDESSVWVFHSGRRFGRKPNRIEGKYLENFIRRVNSLRGVTARDVNIPGEQREPVRYECEQCGYTNVAQWESEKGIDASLTVHLFDTMDSWHVAYLLSGDADFVPAVASLRRRGKIIIGAGFLNAASALVRECYDYIDLSEFLRADVAAYRVFMKDGVINSWLFSDVTFQSENSDAGQPIFLTVGWRSDSGYRTGPQRLSYKASESKYVIDLTGKGPIDLTSRHEIIEIFQARFPNAVKKMSSAEGHYQIVFEPSCWAGVERRLEEFVKTLGDLRVYEMPREGIGYEAKYQYNSQKKTHQIVQNITE